MNDYKMEVHRQGRKATQNTRCYDLPKVLDLGRSLMRMDIRINKIVFHKKKNDQVATLRRNEDVTFATT